MLSKTMFSYFSSKNMSFFVNLPLSSKKKKCYEISCSIWCEKICILSTVMRFYEENVTIGVKATSCSRKPAF